MTRQQSAASRRSSQNRDASEIRSSRAESQGSKAAELEPLPKLTIKIKLNRNLDDRDEKMNPFAPPLNDQSTADNNDIPYYPVSHPSVKTRTGWTAHKPQHEDVIQGSDHGQMTGLSSEGSGGDDIKFQPDFSRDLPNALGNIQYSDVSSPRKYRKRRSVGRPHSKQPSFTSHLDRISEEEDWWSSSSTIPAHSSVEYTSFQPSQDVYDILNSLKATTKTHVDLPSLSNVADPDAIQPYSAELLINLYIICYHENLWNLCDLITDTWIRAFHARRKKAYTEPAYTLWRPNKALEKRQRAYYEARLNGTIIPSEFNPNPRNLHLDPTDPDLEPNVTDPPIHLLTYLYHHTSPTCGARLLWADALALAGDQTGNGMEMVQRRGEEVHPDLVWNVMQSGLRMVRRRLTMKCEESTEGAWCRRYHEHGREGREWRCYREVAAEEEEDEEEWEE